MASRVQIPPSPPIQANSTVAGGVSQRVRASGRGADTGINMRYIHVGLWANMGALSSRFAAPLTVSCGLR